MRSRIILVTAIVVIVAFAVTDVLLHDHHTDSYLTRNLNDLLVRGGFNSEADVPVRVMAEDGWVTLDGQVRTAERHADIEQAVRASGLGLRGLSNRLLIRTCNRAAVASLGQLLDSLRAQSGGGIGTDLGFSVDDDCRVHLRGQVATSAQREAIVSLARSLEGVTGVVSQIFAGDPEVSIQVQAGTLAFLHPDSGVEIELQAGDAARLWAPEAGKISIEVPPDNPRPVGLQLSGRRASASPGSVVGTEAGNAGAILVVAEGSLAVRSASGCEVVGRSESASPSAVGGGGLALPHLHFEVNLDTLPPDTASVVSCVAEILAERPAARLRIVGHSDAQGSEEINDDLSLRRAEAVMSALAGRAVAMARMEVEGRGPREPIGDNSSEAGRALNRRVDLYLLEGGQ